MRRNLKMPWSMEGTVENMDHIRDLMIKSVRQVNLDEKGEEDVREINFDFDRVKEALKKQIPVSPITYVGTNRADCPVCGATMRGIGKPWGNWCSKCGQRLDWTEN